MAGIVRLALNRCRWLRPSRCGRRPQSEAAKAVASVRGCWGHAPFHACGGASDRRICAARVGEGNREGRVGSVTRVRHPGPLLAGRNGRSPRSKDNGPRIEGFIAATPHRLRPSIRAHHPPEHEFAKAQQVPACAPLGRDAARGVQRRPGQGRSAMPQRHPSRSAVVRRRRIG